MQGKKPTVVVVVLEVAVEIAVVVARAAVVALVAAVEEVALVAVGKALPLTKAETHSHQEKHKKGHPKVVRGNQGARKGHVTRDQERSSTKEIAAPANTDALAR